MFLMVKANALSIIKRKPVYGVGINDAKYNIYITVDGSRVMCPFYTKWKNMLNRCYSETSHRNSPSYIGCSVCDEWLLFSNFRRWMDTQDWEGKELDKDIMIDGNKIYSPDTCMFIDSSINTLVRKDKVNMYAKGVSFDKRCNSFTASVHINGKKTYMGSFKILENAEMAYKKGKAIELRRVAMSQSNNAVKKALLRRVEGLK